MLKSHLSNPQIVSTSERHQDLQAAITEIIAGSTEPDHATVQIIQTICAYTDWDFGEIWKVDTDNNCLVHQAHSPAGLARYPKFEEISRQITFSPGLGLPGRVWKTTASIWVPDVIEDVNFLRASFARREGLHSGVGIPLHSREGIVGVMTFFSQAVRTPDSELLALFEMIGRFTGLFIERQRAELRERERLQKEAVLQERLRTGHDLQTTTLQNLFNVAVTAEILPYLWESNQTKLWYGLNELRRLTEKTLTNSQQLLSGMPTEQSLETPLFLDPLLTAFKQKFRGDFSVIIHGTEHLPMNIRIAIYCIAQEALENIIQHAFATRLKFSLTLAQGTNTLYITDNGKGFDLNNVLPDRLGLKIMRGCADSIAARLEIVTAASQGTQILLSWRSVQ